MSKLLVIVFICNGNIPLRECTADTARAVLSFHAPEGVIVCGASMMGASGATGPAEGEYSRVRCVAK